MAKCANCGGLFEAKRLTAKYCSAKCRKLAFRKVSVPADKNAKDRTLRPANFGQPDCECMHCRAVKSNKSNHVLNHGPYKPASELKPNELNRVALPGDVDYRGIKHA